MLQTLAKCNLSSRVFQITGTKTSLHNSLYVTLYVTQRTLLNGRTTMLTHGTEDSDVPIEGSLRTYNQSKEHEEQHVLSMSKQVTIILTTRRDPLDFHILTAFPCYINPFKLTKMLDQQGTSYRTDGDPAK